MNYKFIVRKSLKKILSLKIRKAKNSVLGQLDIMIDSANGVPFNKVVAGNYYRHFEQSIYSISWHGYYQNTKQNKINLPTIHFKDYQDKIHRYRDDVKHIGSINAHEPIAFPLCSLYIPAENSWLDSVKISNYPPSSKRCHYYFKDVNNTTNQRLDIFVTPKNISADTILNSKIGPIYKMADIVLFNTKDGKFEVLKEFQNTIIETYSLDNGHDLIIRTVGEQNSRFSELEGTYSLLLHDPNDAFNRIANRLYVVLNGDKVDELGILKDTL